MYCHTPCACAAADVAQMRHLVLPASNLKAFFVYFVFSEQNKKINGMVRRLSKSGDFAIDSPFYVKAVCQGINLGSACKGVNVLSPDIIDTGAHIS